MRKTVEVEIRVCDVCEKKLLSWQMQSKEDLCPTCLQEKNTKKFNTWNEAHAHYMKLNKDWKDSTGGYGEYRVSWTDDPKMFVVSKIMDNDRFPSTTLEVEYFKIK